MSYKIVNTCDSCCYCNIIGLGCDDTLIYLNKLSEKYKKEVSVFGSCEKYKKNNWRKNG
ncbi:hypothetical protein FUAG_01824 [Fusobacterium ulcerans ATCC 49185]|uniref:DUF3795 domain-containing protein n=1 Tax=Fusobacterium ulcerans TaxID=861 RepID=A0AAX2J8U7_9FUSO|nr:hypothetical protein [Fusobacterium ulcerans]EFS26309.1 hypothetical protein FUAG_01824 [Fusobacterium ulcerans ATCC 49185]SQJ00955.1 Uncharacterised protein [Fusobacterium ulcerans]